MRPYIVLVIIGIIVAGLAALAVRSTIAPTVQQADAPPSVATTQILVATKTITAGSFVQADNDLSWEEWPSEKVQSPPYIIEPEANPQDFNGAVARRTIFAGEPLTQGSVVKPGEGGFMSAVLQQGYRAVSLPVNATTGNAGFIFPGDHVDLILTHAIQNMSGQSFVSETFVENVRVLAVDQMLDNPENKALLAKTVTLEVVPRQAEAINVALEMGKISLALRSIAADAQPQTAEQTASVPPAEVSPETSIDYFYPDAAPPSERAYTRDSDISKLLGGNTVAGQPSRVRVIRGDETTELEFMRPAQ
jgi:pilus assembly protein CpaB